MIELVESIDQTDHAGGDQVIELYMLRKPLVDPVSDVTDGREVFEQEPITLQTLQPIDGTPWFVRTLHGNTPVEARRLYTGHRGAATVQRTEGSTGNGVMMVCAFWVMGIATSQLFAAQTFCVGIGVVGTSASKLRCTFLRKDKGLVAQRDKKSGPPMEGHAGEPLR